jgi:murein DD-endopeptidase MepM/ murein hydrolase activator NlpD
MEAYPRSNIKIAILLTAALLVIFAALPSRESTTMTSVPVSLSIQETETLPESTLIVDELPETEEIVKSKGRTETLVIRNGDSMARLFSRAGLSASTLHEIMQTGNEVGALKKILPGKELILAFDEDNELYSLRYEESPLRNLVVIKSEAGFDAYWEVVEPEVLISYVTGNISESAPSLYHAGKQAGLSDSVIMKLSYVFQWDISFALDLRQGDSFALLYEDIYIDGEKVKEGDIIAAEFRNMGKTFRAVLYEDTAGRKSFYTPEGRSMRKAFLRDPVHFKYVSSSFNLKRLHPIHNRVMPHRGIDYAANKGTPVLASGDGKVTIARQNNASGRYVVIQHGQQYTTKYLHLSAFGKGMRPGKSVSQGDIIGYVGASGWATAPHLHYEFLVNGVHRNPRTVSLPQAKPIPKAELTRFKQVTLPHLARLDSIVGKTGYAMAGSNRKTDGD